jgi:hypothetical protein
LQSGWTKYGADYEKIADRVMVVGAMVGPLPSSPHPSLISSHMTICLLMSLQQSITVVQEQLQLVSVLAMPLSSVPSLVINISGLRWCTVLVLVHVAVLSLTSPLRYSHMLSMS